VQRLLLVAVLVLAVALLAGCGSKKSSSNTTFTGTTTAADNTIYERAYSECASTSLKELAGKYQVANPTANAVSKAVGAAWSKRYHGGDTGTTIGESGCQDGISSRPDSSSSA
jgi:hypothetical protein